MPYTLSESDLLNITNLDLLAKQVVEGFLTGLHKSPYHGFSVEFAEHRQYNNGESTRNIDWKLYARTDKLFVKRYEEETNLRCQILIDTSPSMYFPEKGISKIRFSAIAAASLLRLMKQQRDATGLTLFDQDVWFHAPSKLTLTHQKMILGKMQELLNNQRKTKESNISLALHKIAETLHKRSFIIVFSDMMQTNNDSLYEALQHLRYNKHEVIIFDVKDQELEIDFNFQNRPYLFKDMESGEEVKLHPAAIKETYQNELNKWRNEIKMKCLQNKIDYNEIQLGTDFSQVLLPFFRKRT